MEPVLIISTINRVWTLIGLAVFAYELASKKNTSLTSKLFIIGGPVAWSIEIGCNKTIKNKFIRIGLMLWVLVPTIILVCFPI